MQPSFGCMGVSSAVRFGSTFRILPDQKGRKSKSPPNQPMVGRGTLGFIDYSECLPGPPADLEIRLALSVRRSCPAHSDGRVEDAGQQPSSTAGNTLNWLIRYGCALPTSIQRSGTGPAPQTPRSLSPGVLAAAAESSAGRVDFVDARRQDDVRMHTCLRG